MSQVWLYSGPSSIAISRAVQDKVASLGPADEVMVTDVHGSEIKEGQFPDLRTQDLFGAPRCVIIRQADQMNAALGNVLNADISAGDLAATLILTAQKALSSRKLTKTIKDLGGYIELAVPKEIDGNAWHQLVVDEFRRVGLQPDQDAIGAIIETAGYNLDIISQKVAQVKVGVSGPQVTGEDVTDLVVGHGSRGAFVLADHMVAGEVEAALKALRGCFEAGLEPLTILGALTFKVRQLVTVATGISQAEGGVYIPAAQRRQLMAVRSRFLPGEMTKMVSHLAACDLEIKSGDLGPHAALERCVMSIASSPLWPVPNPQREILR